MYNLTTSLLLQQCSTENKYHIQFHFKFLDKATIFWSKLNFHLIMRALLWFCQYCRTVRQKYETTQDYFA